MSGVCAVSMYSNQFLFYNLLSGKFKFMDIGLIVTSSVGFVSNVMIYGGCFIILSFYFVSLAVK